jgi:hypothetical protein
MTVHGAKSEVPLERDIQRGIIVWLRTRPHSFTIKLAAGPYSIPGLPDVLHIERGTVFFFEVKRPISGSALTKLQAAVMDKLLDAGATVAVVRGLDEVKVIIDGKQEGLL